MEALIILVLVVAAWMLANRLGVLDGAAQVIGDGLVMGTNASTVARVKSDIKRDKFLANQKIDLAQRVRAELNLKRHLKYDGMSIKELEAELERMTQADNTTST